jgi:hypothetical protein
MIALKTFAWPQRGSNRRVPAEQAAAGKPLGNWRASVSKSLFNAAGKP